MYECLHSGFDQFDVAFQGALSQEVRAALAEAKEAAAAQQSPVLVQVGPGNVSMLIRDHGKKGGYAFSCDTGPTGANIWFKDNPSAAQWNIFASVQSKALLCAHLSQVMQDLRQTLEGIGCRVGRESVARIDYAMDFLAPDFILDHTQFVAHRRARVRPHWSAKPEDDNQPSAVVAGRRLESVTIGKMPGRQVIVYDKRREAIDKHKRHWFEVWGIDPADTSQVVWRIELRAGKKHLKDRWQLARFADVEAAIGDVCKHAMEDVRYLKEYQSDTNVTRQQLHPLWHQASRLALYALDEHRCGLTPDQVREIERREAEEIAWRQISGNAATLAVSLGMDDQEIKEDLSAIIQATLDNRIEATDDAIWRSLRRARRHLHFIQPRHQ